MKFKNLIVLVLVTLSVNSLYSQSWQWAGVASDTGKANFSGKITVFPNGDNISINSFKGKLTADPTHTLVSSGGYDICLIKRDNTGQVLWVKSFGGTADDYGHAISHDKMGNIIIGGRFNQTIALGTTTLTSNGSEDIYLAKLDNIGTPIWSRSIGGSTSGKQERILEICTDSLNNIYSVGNFYGNNVNFGGGHFLSSMGIENDMFVFKTDTVGNTQWARSGGSYSTGYDYCEGNSISLSPDGATIICGGFYGGPKFVFGSDTIVNYESGGIYDGYFVSVNSQSGVTNFVRNIQSYGYTRPTTLTFDKTGNIYIAGNTESNAFFTPFTVTNPGGSYGIFLFKYSPSGNFIWSTGLGNSTFAHSASAIRINKQNKIFLAGAYNNYIQLGSFYATNNGGFLAMLDTNKIPLGITSINNTLGVSWGFTAMNLDASDNVYLHGIANRNFTLTSTTYTVPNLDLLTAKYGTVNIATGITSIYDLNQNINIYPNPSSDYCVVSSADEIYGIKVTDVLGRNVLEQKNIPSKEVYINTTNFQSGNYTISVDLKNSIAYKKIIVANNK